MATTKAENVIVVDDPSEVPAEVKVEIRGKRYLFREIEAGEYNKLLKQATHTEPDADGEPQEVIDNVLLLQLMVVKSLADPKITTEQYGKLPMRVSRALNRIVSELHYVDEPVKQISDDEEEEKPRGND
jgi:hypothetical protein